jgi:alanyl-tRNA synthetase
MIFFFFFSSKKDRFLSVEQSSEPSNVVTIQRCMRAGGKHNDLENVGRTPRHHTFFEMMGNFSFGHAPGSYFKREAVHFAWEFLTRHVGLDESRLVVTVLEGDLETEEIWKRELGGSSKIQRMGLEDNFWSMGEEGGPCGPCSEIYWRQDSGELLEIWNLVFMQDRVGGGKLKFQSVDTGMGLERLASVVERVPSNYDTRAFAPLLEAVASRLRVATTSVACRVVADHARAAVFLAADGVLPVCFTGCLFCCFRRSETCEK